MRDEIKPVVIGRVWRDPGCVGEPLAEQHRLSDGQVVVRWRVDPESLLGPVWLQVLEEGTADP
jgi:urocanate hydratase